MRTKCQSAFESMYEIAKQIVEAHHKTPQDDSQVWALRQRLLNFPIRYADLYAIRHVFDCLTRSPALLANPIMRRQLYFLPYFLSKDFLRKLYDDVINWPSEKNLTLKGEPLCDVRARIAKSGTLTERQEVSRNFFF